LRKVCCWDLEGPISVIDFAADIGRMLSKKSELNLQEYDMGEFFFMISNYDDYIIDIPGVKEKLNIPEYQPGDTLRIMAPLYVACFSDGELIDLAKQNLGLLPGCKDLMSFLHENWEVFVISTSYTQFAHNVTATLDIPQDHVYCTELNIEELREGLTSINDTVDILVRIIFQKYIDNDKNLEIVIEDLNDFFWKGSETDYIKVMNQVKVRGGKRKELAVEDIAKRTNIPISEMIALGDSITDINMLQRLKDEDGIAVSFNGNNFTISRATVAVTTPNNLGVIPLFEAKDGIKQFLAKWESAHESFKDNPKLIPSGLISKECKKYFVQYNFVPEIDDLMNKTNDQLKEIIEKQKKMRKRVRGWAGNLG